MAFWGIEVKPSKPYILGSDDERGRLHLSQATLGTGSSTKKSILQCKVGENNPINLCSLLPEKHENCALNLEFEEDDEVTFSVIGPHSVHLTGFYYGDDENHEHHEHLGDCCGSDPYEMGADSDDVDDSDFDSEDEDEDGDDYYSDDDLGMYSSSPVPNSGVRIEEIVEDEKPTGENGMSKREKKKKKSQASTSVDNENSNQQLVFKGGNDVPVFESEDEDGFPISAREKKSASKSGKTTNEGVGEKTKTGKDDAAHGKSLKRKIDAVGQDGPARENIECGSSVQLVPENEVKQKKNKKKKVTKKVESAEENGTPNSNGMEESPACETGNDPKPSTEKKKEKKKKKKNKQQEVATTPNTEEKLTDKKASDEQGKKEAKSLQVRSFPNGLVIEELAMGKPNGKRASPGKKVSVQYIGKLKKTGKIFDSSVGRAPFKFRLGIGQVIKGWDVGVNGMRVGDKRRLTIPPAMGYGAKGCGSDIPGNSWLVFDVELVDVN